MEKALAVARKSRRAWIEAAIATMGLSGVDAVRVEGLARQLGVTKGSFYWHFKDREALLTAVLDEWESGGTLAIIAAVDSVHGSARTRLLQLWNLTNVGDGLAGELAIRDWSRRDPAVAERVARVDDQRMAYVRALFAELGVPAQEVEARAMLLYSLLLGTYFIAAKHGRRGRKRVLDDALQFLLRVDGPSGSA